LRGRQKNRVRGGSLVLADAVVGQARSVPMEVLLGARDEFVDALALVAVTGPLEQFAPGRDIGPAAQQSAALAFGHSAPDTELNSVVERVRKALGADRAAPANELGAVLGSTLDEQLVRVRPLAGGACGPVGDPHVPNSS